jgi:hypothetical protein
MHVAIGYYWSPATTGYHHGGSPVPRRPGCDGALAIGGVIAALPAVVDLYLWVDSAGRDAHAGSGRGSRLNMLAEHFATNDFRCRYAPEEVATIYSQSHIVVNTG